MYSKTDHEATVSPGIRENGLLRIQRAVALTLYSATNPKRQGCEGSCEARAKPGRAWRAEAKAEPVAARPGRRSLEGGAQPVTQPCEPPGMSALSSKKALILCRPRVAFRAAMNELSVLAWLAQAAADVGAAAGNPDAGTVTARSPRLP